MNKLDFTIGARVYCRDGKFGKLVKVVIDWDTQDLKSLVVEKGFLSKRYRVFPVSLVSVAAANEVHLLLANDEWTDYPAYNEEAYEIWPTPWEERPLPKTNTVQTVVKILDPSEVDGGHILFSTGTDALGPASELKEENKKLWLFLLALLTFTLTGI